MFCEDDRVRCLPVQNMFCTGGSIEHGALARRRGVTEHVLLIALISAAVISRTCSDQGRGSWPVSPSDHRTCSDGFTESILGIHVKYNGPLHPAFYKLMLPEKLGDRFVSFASMVHLVLSTAARAKSKYDSELKTYLKNIEDCMGPYLKNPVPP
jgi:hypothetical protein